MLRQVPLLLLPAAAGAEGWQLGAQGAALEQKPGVFLGGKWWVKHQQLGILGDFRGVILS